MAALLALHGCSSSSDGAPPPTQSPQAAVEPMFEIPSSLDLLAEEHWFDHPWPSDMRVDDNGTIHLLGYYNPRAAALIKTYLKQMNGRMQGFSPVASGFLRFNGPIDPSTLPADPIKARAAEASVQLIDVDPASPDKGTRAFISLYWRAETGVYYLPNTLAFMPTLGYPLRPSTRYAVVVTDQVKAADGALVRASSNLRQVLGLDAPQGAPQQALRDRWAGDVQTLASVGLAAEHIVHLSVFTTASPTAETVAVAKDARTVQPAPTVNPADWKLTTQATDYDVYEGTYGPSPDYQAGKPPFTKPEDGGNFGFEGGVPIKQREFFPRFALAIPKGAACAMPAAGYPVVMYAHGTGGSYRSFLNDGTARSLAKLCLASMGVDQILHGPRLPEGTTTPPELLFFNFENVDAARTNPRQSAIDEVVRARLARESGIEVPASVASGGAALKIDGSKVIFYGHSQGGLNGPLFLAVDDGARGGVLSGSGSMISITLLEKTKPDPNVAQMVKTVMLRLYTQEFEELNYFHPAISLAQTLIDVSDPVHYVPMILRNPLPGAAPKSIYQTEGVNPDGTGDSYTPPHAIEVQAVATGLPLMEPVIRPIAEMSWSQSTPVTIPAGGLTGNLASGLASGVLAQWRASEAADGHFVIFDIPAAQNQAAGFCRNLADDPVGKVPAP